METLLRQKSVFFVCIYNRERKMQLKELGTKFRNYRHEGSGGWGV